MKITLTVDVEPSEIVEYQTQLGKTIMEPFTNISKDQQDMMGQFTSAMIQNWMNIATNPMQFFNGLVPENETNK